MNTDSDKFHPVALTIAGSDSGGGAGIQADLRTFSALGVFGCSAVTAVTAQNPWKVSGIHPVPAQGVADQIRTVFEEFQIGAVKTGMLFSRPIVETVVEALRHYSGPLVVDPVMVSTSGAKLLEDSAVEAVLNLLLPRAAWITPNIPEGEIISGRKITSLEEMKVAAEKCAKTFGCSVILKGGHLPSGDTAPDMVVAEGKAYWLSGRRLALEEHVTHGTGCTFSAALAAGLAKGIPSRDAVFGAKRFVFESLRNNVRTGTRTRSMFPREMTAPENAGGEPK